jgi:hypothetical protein
MKGCRKFEGRGPGIIPVNLIFMVPVVEGMGHMKPLTAKFHGRRSKKDKIRKKTEVKLQNQCCSLHSCPLQYSSN